MQKSGGGIISVIITYVYCFVVIVAPILYSRCIGCAYKKAGKLCKRIFSQRNKKHVLIIGEGKYQFAFIDGLVKDCRVTVIVSRMLSEDTKLKYINKGVKIIQKYGDMSIETIFKSLDIRKFNDIFLCDESAIANIEYLKFFI